MAETMRAVELQAFAAPLELVERPRPVARGEDETVVRVLACGLCHSDLHVVEHYFSSTPLPLILGHEVAAELPDGEPALIYTPWGCGHCRWCAEGHEAICPDSREAGMISDGGYADYMLVPHRRYLLPLGDLDPVQAAPLTCGGVTAYRATKHLRDDLRPGDRVAVIGAGGLGQYAIQALRLTTDAEVVAIDPSPAKRQRALELGAAAAAAPGELDERVRGVIDFVGAEATVREAASLVDRKGTRRHRGPLRRPNPVRLRCRAARGEVHDDRLGLDRRPRGADRPRPARRDPPHGRDAAADGRPGGARSTARGRRPGPARPRPVGPVRSAGRNACHSTGSQGSWRRESHPLREDTWRQAALGRRGTSSTRSTGNTRSWRRVPWDSRASSSAS